MGRQAFLFVHNLTMSSARLEFLWTYFSKCANSYRSLIWAETWGNRLLNNLVLTVVISLFSLNFAFANPPGTHLPQAQTVGQTPRDCATAVQSPKMVKGTNRSSFAKWLMVGGLTCTGAGATVYACSVVSNIPSVSAGFFGAILALGIQNGLGMARRLVAPQLDFVNQWLDRAGYAANLHVLARLAGRPPRRAFLGDLVSPNVVPDMWGRHSPQQRFTADRLDSMGYDFDWLGMLISQMLREGRYEDAGAQFVSTVARLAYTSEEVLQRTQDIHSEPMVREILMLSFRGFFVEKLETLARADPTVVDKFEAAVRLALQKYSTDFPGTFSHYERGIRIVVQDWMAETVGALCADGWCVLK